MVVHITCDWYIVDSRVPLYTNILGVDIWVNQYIIACLDSCLEIDYMIVPIYCAWLYIDTALTFFWLSIGYTQADNMRPHLWDQRLNSSVSYFF